MGSVDYLMRPTLRQELDGVMVKEVIDKYYFSELEKIKEISSGDAAYWVDHVALLESRKPLLDLREEKPFLYDFSELKRDALRKISFYGGVSIDKIKGLESIHNIRESMEVYMFFKYFQEAFFCLLAVDNEKKNGLFYSETSSFVPDKYASFKKEAVSLLREGTGVSAKSVLASPFVFFASIPETTEYLSRPLSEIVENGSCEFDYSLDERAEMEALRVFNINTLRLVEAYSDNEMRALGLTK